MPDENGKPLRSDLAPKRPVMTNATYQLIKDVLTIGYPAAITLYGGLAVIWNWSLSDEIVATGGLVGVFLGVLLKIAQKRYENIPVSYDGALLANDPDPNHDTYRLEFDRGIAELASQDVIRLKVVDLLDK